MPIFLGYLILKPFFSCTIVAQFKHNWKYKTVPTLLNANSPKSNIRYSSLSPWPLYYELSLKFSSYLFKKVKIANIRLKNYDFWDVYTWIIPSKLPRDSCRWSLEYTRSESPVKRKAFPHQKATYSGYYIKLYPGIKYIIWISLITPFIAIRPAYTLQNLFFVSSFQFIWFLFLCLMAYQTFGVI